ncbi:MULTISPECIES: DUF58 domain-containing protein [unclassified Wenzhouxiangella]|uniref:DUF58 domain-containing protein n=1 Tax=unclassified Wenzhouxiangella TaxID=2613841 RepID=UPI000E326637|nr:MULTISPECIES: DUF58 domain-containing protein [unclassified Wenzhouxiangella]RFF26352.1 DUF58 domain-containing protein [Wenzhouxiangella sp. 15181]RFP67376.1 DUF58 domain-containing protein [Wenzhouxiangella sp. 15190]
MATATGSPVETGRPKLLDRWLKRRTRLDLPLTLAYRRIFILPTRFGWMLGLLMGAMLIGSLNFNNNLGLLTTFIVAATAINSMLLAFRNLNGLHLRHGAARPVHAGKPVPWRLTAVNHCERNRDGLRLKGPGPDAVFNVPARGVREVTIELDARGRGWHRPGRLRIETTQPLGLFRAWSWIEPTTPFLVWPQPAEHAPPLPEGGDAQSVQRRQAREEGEDFHSLRRWREGDPLHRIAWKASQRHQTLLSRQFRREQSREVFLSLERAPGRDLEERIRIVTAWILRAEAENRSWTLELGEERFGPDRSESHKHACMRALAEL